MGWVLALPVLALLLGGCATTAKKSAAPLEPPKPYLRVERAPDSTLSLQVAVRQLQGPRRRSPEILLVGVAHIGESNYFATLQRQLDACPLVLFEGVGGRPEKPSPAEASAAGDGQLGSLQSRLARALGLVFQLDAIDYDRPHFKNSDVKLERLFELMQGEGKAQILSRPWDKLNSWAGGGAGSPHPALSPRRGYAARSAQQIWRAPGSSKPSTVLPLPQGEGRGEGEAGAGYPRISSANPKSEKSGGLVGGSDSMQNWSMNRCWTISKAPEGQPSITTAWQAWRTPKHGGVFERHNPAGVGWNEMRPGGADLQRAMVIPALLNITIPEEAGTQASASRGLDDLVGIMDGTSLLGALAHTLVEMIGASPRLQATVKVVLIETMGALEGDLAQAKGLPPDLSALMDVLIRERNQVVLADVRAALGEKKAPRRIAIFYGAGHMHDLEQRLCVDLGYRPVADQWLTAFSLNPRAAGLSEMELNMVRSLVKWQMEQLQQGGK